MHAGVMFESRCCTLPNGRPPVGVSKPSMGLRVGATGFPGDVSLHGHLLMGVDHTPTDVCITPTWAAGVLALDGIESSSLTATELYPHPTATAEENHRETTPWHSAEAQPMEPSRMTDNLRHICRRKPATKATS